MHADWVELMSAYTSDSSVLIASADCETSADGNSSAGYKPASGYGLYARYTAELWPQKGFGTLCSTKMTIQNTTMWTTTGYPCIIYGKGDNLQEYKSPNRTFSALKQFVESHKSGESGNGLDPADPVVHPTRTVTKRSDEYVVV